MRLQRTADELVAGASKPTEEEIKSFYSANRSSFNNPTLYHVAQIVISVNESRDEETREA